MILCLDSMMVSGEFKKMIVCVGLIVYLTVVSGDTGSNSYVYGGGGVGGVGQVQLVSHSLSQYQNGLPSSLGQSTNNGSGTSVSINGQANSGVNVNYVNDNVPNQVITGNSNANSNGNAATGQLTNADHSNSDNTNGLALHGHSQITGNGTGVSISNSANSNAAKYPITTTTPWSTGPCAPYPSWCPCPCIVIGGDACACPSPPYPMPVDAPKAAPVARNRQTAGRQRQRSPVKNSPAQRAHHAPAAHGPQRTGNLQRPLTGLLSNARKRS